MLKQVALKRAASGHLRGRLRRRSPQDSTSEPWEEFQGVGLIRMIFKAHLKVELRSQLEKFGVSARFLFPGIDGLAKTLAWRSPGEKFIYPF